MDTQKIMSTNPYFSMALKDVTAFSHLSNILVFHVNVTTDILIR